MKRERYAGWVILVGLIAVGCWANAQQSQIARAEKQSSSEKLIEKDKAEAEKAETKRQQLEKSNPALADTKKKGVDGLVDFYYDNFMAPPAQDAHKASHEVMEKDVADKPKVMAKQNNLLKDRYELDCKAQSGLVMTKGKPQPVGPMVK
ncbi:hypothetical protein [Nitrospira sp. Nam80]